jgi:hypothetical protein
MTVPAGAGAGTSGEVGDAVVDGVVDPRFDGDAYKDVLPVVVAEIHEVSSKAARGLVAQLLHFSNDGLFA